MKEVLLALLSGALETVGESKLVEVLQKLAEKDFEKYKNAIQGGYSLAKLLVDFSEDSKTPIDDAIANSLKEAIEKSAEMNSVELPS